MVGVMSEHAIRWAAVILARSEWERATKVRDHLDRATATMGGPDHDAAVASAQAEVVRTTRQLRLSLHAFRSHTRASLRGV
jgi:hypothetical protein